MLRLWKMKGSRGAPAAGDDAVQGAKPCTNTGTVADAGPKRCTAGFPPLIMSDIVVAGGPPTTDSPSRRSTIRTSSDSREVPCVDASSGLGEAGAAKQGVAAFKPACLHSLTRPVTTIATKARNLPPPVQRAVRSAAAVLEKYEVEGFLGEGSTSIVLSVVTKDDLEGRRLACKILTISNSEGDQEEADRRSRTAVSLLDTLREVRVLKALRHPNIVRLHEVKFEGDKCAIVTDLLEGGDLFDAVIEKQQLSESQARDAMAGILRGLLYVHGEGVAHRDLKLENVMLARRGDFASVKIVDFGLAKRLSPSATTHTRCGSPLYIAPEVLCCDDENEGIMEDPKYGLEADVWSCGVMLYIMLSGFEPFEEGRDGVYGMFRKISRGEWDFNDPCWEGVSREARHLVERMMTLDPRRRITVKEALQHPWIIARSGSKNYRAQGPTLPPIVAA